MSTTSLRERILSGKTLVVGHRGAMGYRPENTLVSFAKGHELGADLIEFDVHMTRDGHLVVIHDEKVDRTTNGHGFVKDQTLAELQALDAGSWFAPEYADQRICTLDEVLAWASGAGTMVDIEIKHGPFYYPGLEAALVSAIDRHGLTDHALVIAFDHASVARVKALDSRLATGVLYAGRPVDALGLARAANADALLPHWAYVTAEDVQRAHGEGIAIAPWATSDPQILTMLVQAGVDGIGTNHPDILRRIVDGS